MNFRKQVIAVFLVLICNRINSQIVYSANRNSNTSTVINSNSNTIITTINCGLQAECVAVNKILNKIYIANNGGNSISVINPCSNIVESTISVGVYPAGISVSPDGQRLYVPIYSSNQLQVINTATNAIITSITVGSLSITAPEQCVVSPDNSRVYLTLFDVNKVAVIDAATNTVLTYYDTDNRPTGVDISNDGTRLYVANQNDNSLIVYNTGTGARIATISLGPVNLAIGGAAGVVLNHANTKVYVAVQDASTVKIINTATNTITNTIAVGGRPFGLDILPDDSRLYVSCVNANRMDVINTITETNILNIPTGNAPYSYGKFIIKKNIDSVKIIPTPTSCNSFNFQGQAFVNGVPISGWQWYFGDGGTDNVQNTSHTYLTANTYTVKLVVTDANGCKDSITTNVTSGTAASANAGNDSTVCAGIPFNLLIYGTSLVTYSWSPAGLVSNPSIANPVANISGTQKFYCTVTNSSGCSVTDSVTYTVVPMTVNTTNNTNLCNGSTLQLNTTGAVSYSWSPAGGLSNPLIGNPIASPTITTKYYVTGTSAQGCTALDSITINVIPAPTVVTTNDSAICTGTSIQLNTTGAASYSWSPVAGLSNPSIANPIATPFVLTQYIVTGTAANGCIGKDTVNISLKPLPVITATNDSTICTGLSVQLNASGSLTYSWSPVTGLSNPSIANPIATPLVPTQYIVTGTAVNGCSGKDTVNISLNPLPVVDATPDNNLCIGSSVQLNTTGAATYSWSPAIGLSNTGIPNPIASPTVNTKYYVTGTDANGCTNVDSVTISIIPVPTVVTTTDSAICTGTSIQLNTTGAVSYSWSPVAGLNNPSIPNPIATPLVNTQYIVTGTAANGCTAKDTVNISLKPLPVIIATNDSTICSGLSVQLNASGGVTYSWSPATGLSNAAIPNPIATPLVNTQYIVMGTAPNGCIGTDTVNINLSPPPVIVATNDNNLCTGSSIQLNATGASTYSWSPVLGLSNPLIPNPVASPTVTTKYYVTGTSATGCTGIDSVTITLIPVPSMVSSPDSNICTGTGLQLNTSGAVSYSWSPVAGLNNATIPNPIATPLVNTQYIVTGTAANGCTAKDTVNIGLKPLPVVIKSNDTTICNAGSAQLNVSGGINYSWTPVTGLNNPSIPNPIASPTISTLYKVTVTGANACNKLDSIQITMSAAPVYTISPPSSICNNSSLQLSAGGGDLYSWLPVTGLNNSFIANPQASPNITTPYTVRIISTACHDTAFRNTIITVNPLPNITALKSNDINCSFSTAQLFATGAVNYVWSPSTGLNNATIANPVANITTTTTYNVTGTDFNGCFATATVTVQAGFVAGGNLYIPNAFTPNGDGKNDCFGIRVYGTVNSFELTVFNRYGEKIFYTTDPLKCWNGIYKTKKQQIGNYVYIVNAKTSCGDFFKKGNILLLQ